MTIVQINIDYMKNIQTSNISDRVLVTKTHETSRRNFKTIEILATREKNPQKSLQSLKVFKNHD